MSAIIRSCLSVAVVVAGMQAVQAHESRPGFLVIGLDAGAKNAATGLRGEIRRSLEDFGGRIILRDTKPKAIVGDAPSSITVIRFRSVDRAEAWTTSGAAKKLGNALQKGGQVSVTLLRDGS